MGSKEIDPPEEWVREIRHLLKPRCTITLERFLKRGKYRRVHRLHASKFINPSVIVSFNIAQTLYQEALGDLAKHPDDGNKFRVTIDTPTYRRSKHFDIPALESKASPASQVKSGFICKDCKDTGWYTGLIERRRCPTCGGQNER